MEDLFILTKKQQIVFNELKKAYKKCEKANIFFYNNYGTVGALDRGKIINYTDNENGIFDSGQNVLNEFRHPAGDSWADDNHYFIPA